MLNFLGIGAQKAGTTWIAENLEKHPDIDFPASKEIHFWNAKYERGVDWYRSLFAAENGKLHGEITPAYAFLNIEKIKEVYQLNPALRLIYCVRNPIDRAWSSARMALGRAEMAIDEASDQWFTDHFRSKGSLVRGDYIMAVDNWLSVFPKEQLLVLNFADITNNPADLLQKCCRHIGVDAGFFSEKRGHIIRRKVHESVSLEIRKPLLAVLHELYDDKIRQMAKHPVLGELGIWSIGT